MDIRFEKSTSSVPVHLDCSAASFLRPCIPVFEGSDAASTTNGGLWGQQSGAYSDLIL